ncbi:MAG: trigger factor [Evtepia sp.]|jgi:trigger factor|nr:trigger factor [Evtepia sp.]
MNVKSSIDNKEKFSVELTVEVGAEEFEAALERAYKKNRGSISVPGFRKGKAPRKVIEGMYGSGVFYQDAIEELYPKTCEEAIVSQNLDVVAPPHVEILEVGKEGFTFKADVTVRPEVTLGNYKGLEANKVLATVTDESLEKELQTYIDRATRLEAVERSAENGDTAVIDFEGFKEGIPFQGGKGENFELILGSNSFIPGFEDQVVGMSAGEEKEIDVTFPEDYQAEELAGKPAKFKVKLHEVKAKVTPELDDEFAKDVSEFETLASFKEDLRAKIADRNMVQSEAHFKQALLDQLGDMVKIELPEPMVEAQIDRIMGDYSSRLENQGITMEMYMSYMQMNEQMMRAELKSGAEKQIRTQLALDAVVKVENIQIPDEEVAEEFKKIAESMNVSIGDVESVLSKDTFKRDMARDRAIDLVASNAKANLISEEEAMKIEEVSKDADATDDKEKAPKKTRTKKTAEKTENVEAEPKKATARKSKKAEPKKEEEEAKVEE